MDPQPTTPAADAQAPAATPAEITTAEITPAAVTTPAEVTPAENSPATSPAIAAGDLEKVRELVLKANPEVVPDLVRGESIDELLASVEPARGAYQRIADAVRAGGTGAENPATNPPSAAAAQPPTVPAGGGSNVVDPSSMAPTTKIAQGLAQQRKA